MRNILLLLSLSVRKNVTNRHKVWEREICKHRERERERERDAIQKKEKDERKQRDFY